MLYSVTYAVFNSLGEPVSRGNAPTLARAKELADSVKGDPLLRVVTETNGLCVISHSRKPGKWWVEQPQKGRRPERVERPIARPKCLNAP